MSETSPTESRQSVLLDVARRLSSTQNLEELLDHILQRSREVMDCEVCSILLPDGPNNDLLIRSTLDPINAEPVRVPSGKGIAGDVFASKTVVNIRDARNDPRHFTPAADKSGLVTRAMLTVPLLEADHCLGVMQAINPNNEDFFEQQDEELFETFGSLISVTLMRLESQKKAIRDAQNRQELNLAKEIQDSFLPPAEVRIGDFEIEAFYEPASEIGGDFFFWHELEDGKILLGIGDVCGKGLPAALDMARGTTLIASTAHTCGKLGLAPWITELNSRLCDVMSAGRFIAISAMLINPESRRVNVCVAGLPPPKLYDGSFWIDADTPGNPPLGISCTVKYTESESPIGVGRHWLIFSDGILELQNQSGAYFEDDALDASLRSISTKDSKTILGKLVRDWHAFGGGDANYLDDATVIAISDHKQPPRADCAIDCKPEALKEVRDFVEQWTAYCGLTNADAGFVVLGCDEVFSNICKYAYCSLDGKSDTPANCHVEAANGWLRIMIEHHGEGITNEDFEKLIAPPSHGERIGGLGMFVISEVFDKIDFRKEPGKSTIELVKRAK